MKRFLTMLCAMVMPLLADAQEKTDLSLLLKYEDGVAHFSEVIQVNGATADNLYRNAIMWINATFNNPRNVIHTDNKELGLLTIKSAVGYPDILMTHFILDVQVKDGRYKYDLHHLVMKYGRYLPDTPDKTYEEYIKTSGVSWKKGINNDFGDIIKSLKVRMDDIEESW